MSLRVRVLSGIDEVPSEAWDAISGPDDPFSEHAFHYALEASGSVSAEAGWAPRHVTVWRGKELVGATTLYLKTHSYGEFIFDWSWANASHRAGIPYYPKLVGMTPLTPATGSRFLVAEGESRAEIITAIIRGVRGVAEDHRVRSIHLLFLSEEDKQLSLEADDELFPRFTTQFHWHNRGYDSWDDYLGAYRASTRKQARKERKRANGCGAELAVLTGEELTDEDWAALPEFYVDTCHKRGSPTYLKPSFFDLLREHFSHRVVVALARDGKRPIAGSLNFEKGAHLYGRYWGCTEENDSMHFELCYYRLIERAIDKKMTRFEAGAGGGHKLRRGLEPSPIHSVHYVEHPALSEAVRRACLQEAMYSQQDMEEMAPHGPYKRGPEGG